jgi:uncharacterized protein (TIGR00730 family)
MSRICLFCASSTGNDARYADAARRIGTSLAQRGVGLVYGGGKVGLMGIAADAALAAGGEVVGVIPRGLETAEIAHRGLTALHVTGSMHERKQLMHDLSDGFVTLPGGFGTMDEMFEALTWRQIGVHDKPVGLLNVAGFYDGLIGFMDAQVEGGLLRAEHRAMLRVSSDSDALLDDLVATMPAQPIDPPFPRP